MEEKIRFNCSDESQMSSTKKLWSVELEHLKKPDCTSLGFLISLRDRRDFPDGTKVYWAQISHTKFVMNPIIYEADESLRELQPNQLASVVILI